MKETSWVKTTWLYTEQEFLDSIGIGSGYYLEDVIKRSNTMSNGITVTVIATKPVDEPS